MLLAPGARLGPFEIVGSLGAGGMGEVYKARDTRLDRTVAIKVISELIAEEPELRRRLESEARAISKLNHPHICTLYDVGRDGATDYLVLEYLQGETLADRLIKGAIPPDQVIALAIQIAEALRTAHRAGIVHRDLKPGNIMLVDAREGPMRASLVKLLDFGLARTFRVGQDARVNGASAAPTIAAPATARGTILGTLQYMAPEQLEGREVDARTDIWAFGCVLYEMLTGQKAFASGTEAGVIGAILERDPAPIRQLLPAAQPGLARLIGACLEKEPDDRIQSAHDLVLQLRWIADEVPSGQASARHSGRRPLAFAFTGLLVGATAAALLGFILRPIPEGAVIRAAIPLPPGGAFGWFGSNVAMSPDGQQIVYMALESSRSRLYIRPIDRDDPRPIRGTEDAESPFFSPDGTQVGFYARGKLKRVSLDGGPAVEICDAAGPRGAAWAADDTIIFSPSFNEGLFRVNASGGTPQRLTTLDASRHERTHRFPDVLPDARTVLFMVGNTNMTSYSEAEIVARPLDGGASRVILRGGLSPRYVPSGYLAYGTGDTLMAVPFDAKRLEVTGSPVTVAEKVAWSTVFGTTHYAVGGSGHVVYIPGGETLPLKTIAQLDRSGSRAPFGDVSGYFSGIRLSPDGERILFWDQAANDLLRVYDIRRQALSRLTFRGNTSAGAWTPDGQRVVYIVGNEISRVAADGSGEVETLYADEFQKTFLDVSPDGNQVVFDTFRPGTRSDIMLLSVQDGRVSSWHVTRFAEAQPRMSPNGRWIAYVSDETGRFEVFVKSTIESGRKVQVSTAGGTSPVWSKDGTELFFVQAGDLFAVDFHSAPIGAPRLLVRNGWSAATFTSPAGHAVYAYDAMPDGHRFLLTENQPPPVPTRINLIWGALPPSNRN
jgi:serine/threonine-protein kinase